ncbi:unnamed protein product [Rotaria sordida]|uniref:Uncharacterized protein n=1 Tax=Rotaria sordida TaxID=392033 RepID=A0A815WMN6_9BILA|nr:unnamed protein product [Rotaria sordida]CAF1551070.1 unnamed protein product [Rotaria sordida]
MSQVFFIKRDLTGSMGLLRHYPTDLVNNVLGELINYELVRQGRTIISNISNDRNNTNNQLLHNNGTTFDPPRNYDTQQALVSFNANLLDQNGCHSSEFSNQLSIRSQNNREINQFLNSSSFNNLTETSSTSHAGLCRI